jgi:hypothetical protein
MSVEYFLERAPQQVAERAREAPARLECSRLIAAGEIEDDPLNAMGGSGQLSTSVLSLSARAAK